MGALRGTTPEGLLFVVGCGEPPPKAGPAIGADAWRLTGSPMTDGPRWGRSDTGRIIDVEWPTGTAAAVLPSQIRSCVPEHRGKIDPMV